MTDAQLYPLQVYPLQDMHLDQVLAIEQQAQLHPWPQQAFVDCLQANYHNWVLGHTTNTHFSAPTQPPAPVIGYLITQNILDELHILNLCIAPQWQRQGYGKYLLNYCQSFAHQQHCTSLLLEVRRSNSAAKQLYQQAQFELIGVRKNYYPGPTGREDAEVYRRQLN